MGAVESPCGTCAADTKAAKVVIDDKPLSSRGTFLCGTTAETCGTSMIVLSIAGGDCWMPRAP